MPRKIADPIESLKLESRRALLRAPEDGRYVVPYTVGEAFKRRGWGDHLGKKSDPTQGKRIPTTLFQLNADGLAAALQLRQDGRSEVDATTYRAVREQTLDGIHHLLEDESIDSLIRNAEATVERLNAARQPTAGIRGYRDALIEYRDASASA